MAGEVATLIGDVVGSRGSRDRAGLHRLLEGALDEANAATAPLTPLRLTIGDEYQGVFATPAAAVRAALRLRLALLPSYDVRHGIGWGSVSVLADEPRVEDGPAWWAARDAIEEAEQDATRAAGRHRRTCFRLATDVPPESAIRDVEPWLSASLMLIDQQVGGLSERSLSVLRGLLAGRTQKEIAADLQISASAVSQRVRADGLAALVAAHDQLEEER